MIFLTQIMLVVGAVLVAIGLGSAYVGTGGAAVMYPIGITVLMVATIIAKRKLKA